ncbi:LysR substrate-binding domain-containing protein [Streptomyces sp. NPDC000410]|uniref:LysR substrate-binding domain-containing protein n=1 Tax=Streptomyces sp. NPDC000410 TaxID=3154254 RepID=UPI00332896ED
MTWADLPPLGTLVAFEATVRHGSVTRAAAELHLTHGAVSRQIRQLEQALGTPLFERRNRAVVPTEAARTLARDVGDALGALSAAARRARAAAEPGRPLVLSCEPTLLMRWLIPRLPLLAEAAPGLDLHLVASGGPVPFDREGIDVAIRRDDFALPEGVPAHPLFAELIGPVCSPEHARRLSSPADLAGLPRLHTRTRPTAWDDWATRAGADLPAAPEQTFEHFSLSLQAAASGLGVAIGPLALVHDDLKAGRLLAPYGFEPDGSAYVLLAAPAAGDERVSALLAWLGEQAGRLLL